MNQLARSGRSRIFGPVLALLRNACLALATLFVVVVVSWGGVPILADAELDEQGTLEMADADADGGTQVRRGGPPSMQEEDDEVHSGLLVTVGWVDTGLRVVRWPALEAEPAPRDERGERPPYAGPLERPPHA